MSICHATYHGIGTDDITFCADQCDDRECYRHPSNIIDKCKTHSFAYLRDTELCEREREKNKMTQIENHCVGCQECHGSCANTRVPVTYCDKCGDEIPNSEDVYDVDGRELCEDCLHEMFRKRW